MTLQGSTIIDSALADRRGTILTVNDDGTVTVMWKPGQYTDVTPVAGRYQVIA